MFPDIQNELLANFASLTMTSISKLGEGWDNEAYLVNNKIVFKILKQRAKHIQSETARHAKVEIKLLRFLYNKLPVQTPAILYATDDGACYGYEYLNGTSLSLEHLKEGSQKQSYIKIWVSTAIALERLLSLAEATTLGLEKFQYNAYRLGRVAEVMKRDLLDSELNQVAQDCLDHYITEWEDAQLIITHGDAGLGNWIFDPKSSTYGLIDWADACIATAELQIFRLVQDIPDELKFILKSFEQASGRQLNRKLIFLCGAVSHLSIIGELLEHEQKNAALAKLNQLKQWARLRESL